MTQPPQISALVSYGASYCIRSKAFGLFVVFGLFFALMTVAVQASSITEGFDTSVDLPIGAVVSVSQTDPSKVELTNTNNSSFVAGVTAGASDGLVALGNSASRAFVTVSGDSPVLVSNVNGDIRKGDLLGPSAISGVAQRTTVVDGGRVFGVALSDFDLTSGRSETVDNKQVTIGLVPMRILLTEVAGRDTASVPFLQKVGVAVSGSEVSSLRLIIASIIFLTIMFVSGIILFTSIRGTFDSIGRNPLASDTIFKHLIHVTIVTSTAMIIGLAAAYLVVVI